MRASYNELRRMVDFPYTPDELAERLTNVGLEVKEIQTAGEEKGVVVGKILTVKKHPNADKLKIVEVDTGKDKISLVCGAPNVEEGRYVAVAVEGAQLPGGIRVKKVNIRGISSPGMICSERELGLGEDHSGVMIFSSELQLGERFYRALGLEDTIFDIELTSNRGDCLSILGIAREIAAIAGKKVRLPDFHFKDEQIIFEDDVLPIKIEAPELCPFYAARIIRGIKIAPSPLWLRWKILLSGAKPVNNVVDVTNYVMWELGQPLHPFDLETLAGPQIIVRRAKQGEALVTLDDKERKLSEDMLVIANAEEPIAIAGIMGGRETEVTEATEDILLEAAYFSPISVSRTSRKLDLSSEASSRFERGVDAAMVEKAMDRASVLIQKVAGGKIVEPSLGAGKPPVKKKEVYFRPSKVNRITGLRIPSFTSEKILKNLGFEVKKDKENTKNMGKWIVYVPGFRHDIEREIDLVEEIARIHGYNKIGISLPQPGGGGGKDESGESVKKLLRGVLKGSGFYEVITNPLIGERLLKAFRESLDNLLSVRNPLSIQQKFLRPHLFHQLVDVASFNYNQESENLRLMEMGKIFAKNNGECKETSCLCGVTVENGFDFYRLKGIVEVIFDELRVGEVKFCPCSYPYFYKGEAACIKKGEDVIGFFGKLYFEICQDFKLPSQTYLFELNLDLITSLSKGKTKYHPLPRFPAVKRDLSFVVREEVCADEIKEIVLKQTPYIEKVEFFDFYQGPNIPEGYKSISFSLIFRHPKKTLTDSEVDSFQDKIIKLLQDRWQAYLRAR
ncbi:phenylalanine--tRNA ligase subunit beta [Candidatus Aerophobetes bacterium]|nr:phenylalanine--tRNA ligase subunit beta [Candidatus Aerophobetes bacterium]